jgi:S-adenosylhomocysteine hydrolase
VKGKLAGQVPTAIVIGGYGRVGSGAVKMLQSVGIEPTIWDHDHTQGKSM